MRDYSFSYIECSIAEELTISEYRRSRRSSSPRPRLRLRRRIARAALGSMSSPAFA